MEALLLQQQEAVKKMSSDRLREKLVSQGYDVETVRGMDRETLLNTYAEILTADKPELVGVASQDMDIERERLQLEKMTLDFEMRKHAEEMDIKRAELKMKDERPACLKRYGEALRNVLIRQSNDPVEVVAFFRNAEATFKEINVPQDLRGILIRPYLNDRSKALVARLDPERSVKYQEIKDLILKEYKLSPASYQEKFTTLTKDDSETFTMFSSRLQSLIDGYLESRHVTKFNELCELLLCDRVKSTLNESLLRYILAVESKTDKGWMSLNDLTAAIDTYVANHIGDRPRAGVLTAPKSPNFGHQKYTPTPHKPNNSASFSKPENKFNLGCFVCGSKSHIKRDCPSKTKSVASEQGMTPHKANRCVTNTKPAVGDETISGADTVCKTVENCNDTEQQPTAGPIMLANDVKCDLSNFVFSDVCNNFAESHNDVTAETSIHRDDVNSDELAYTQLIGQ